MKDLDVNKLQNLIGEFVSERNWKQFHTPKNLCMALNIETSELMEIFKWLTPEESFLVKDNEKVKEEIEDEMGDVFAYFLMMAKTLEIDIEKALVNKMKKNAEKYPVSKARGNCKKYSEL